MNNPSRSGLRKLFNGTKQPAKVELVIPPNDGLAVSDEVAAQLVAASTAFKDGEPPVLPDPPVDVVPDASHDPGLMTADEIGTIEAAPEKKPTKRAAKKAN